MICAWVAAVMLLSSGCTSRLGSLPRIQALSATEGYKMLRPSQTVSECSSDGIGGTNGPDLLEAAIGRLLARDAEADSIINARVESTEWSIGVYGRRCVTVTGDVVRSASTILLPMPGGHEGHGSHEGHSGH
jgi:hypothetical protein